MLHSTFHIPSSTYFCSYFKHEMLQFGFEKQNRSAAFFGLVYSHSTPSPGQNQQTDVEASKQSPAQMGQPKGGSPKGFGKTKSTSLHMSVMADGQLVAAA